MCKRNFPDKNKASKGCVGETPQIKRKEKKKRKKEEEGSAGCASKRSSRQRKRRRQDGMCKKLLE